MADKTKGAIWTARTAPARWFITLCIAAAATYYFIKATERESVCHQVVTGTTVARICGPPSLTQLVPALLLIGLLLLPDLSEIRIAGLLSLRRRVSEQGVRLDRTERDIQRIEQRVIQTQHVNVYLGAEAAIAREGLERKAVVFERAVPSAGPPAREAQERIEPLLKLFTEVTPARAESDAETGASEAAAELLRLSRSLDAYEAISRLRAEPGHRHERMAHLSEAQQESVDIFFALFKEEVQTVRDVRNALVHRPSSVDERAVVDTVAVAKRLVNILMERLDLPHRE